MMKHTATSSHGGSCSDLDSSRGNRMCSTDSSIDESFEPIRANVFGNAEARKEGTRMLTLNLEIPSHQTREEDNTPMKLRSASFTNISSNDEEFVEEIKKGDKTLTYHKRRSISPSVSTPSEEVPQFTNNYLNIQRSNEIANPVHYENFWRSQDDLLPSPPHCEVNQIQNRDGNTNSQPIFLSQLTGTRGPDQDTGSSRTPCAVHSQHALNSGKYRIFSPTRRSRPSSRKLSPAKQMASQHNLSIQSDDSYGRRYLDLPDERNDLSVIANRNIRRGRKHRLPSVSADSSVSKYLSNGSSTTYYRDCHSPVSVSTLPVETSEMNNNNVRHSNNPNTSKTTTNEYNKASLQDVIDRRTEICKFVAIFCVILTSIVCVLVGVLHFYVGYYPEVSHLNQGDVKVVPASAYFCSSIKAVSRTSILRVLAFKKKSHMKSIENTFAGRFMITPASVWSRDFFLLKGSNVKLKVNSVYTVLVMVFVSKNKFSIWSQRKQSETYLKSMECCGDTKARQKTLYFNASRDERYFIAIHNHIQVIPVNIDLEITLVRKSYDFTDTTHHCLTGTPGVPCSVDYAFNNGEYAALEIPLSKGDAVIPTSSEVEWECVARVWFYIVLFLVVFVVIGVGIFTSYFVAATICIPSGRYCCRIYDKSNDESVEFIYHNKYTMRKNGAVDTAGGLITSDRTQFMSSDTNRKIPLYYQVDASTPYTRHHTNEHISREEQRVEADIATIYERNRGGDNADSGISVGVDYAPSRQSYRQEIIKLRELQIQQLKMKYPEERIPTSVLPSRANCSYKDTMEDD